MPDYDSEWINITDKAGQYITLDHDLNYDDVLVDITGQTAPGHSVHQIYFSLTFVSIPGWNQTYGGADYDYGQPVVQTSDGGYAIAGQTNSYGNGGADYYLVKAYANGTMQWGSAYGGGSDDDCRSVVQTVDGGFALVGNTNSFGAGGSDVYLIKTGVEGEFGLARVGSTSNTLTLYRGLNDVYWNYVRARIWKID